MSTHSTSGGRPGLELPIDIVQSVSIFGFRPCPCAAAHRLVSGRGQCRPTTIAIHVSRSQKARRETKLLLGRCRPSIFPVSRRLTASAVSSENRPCHAFIVAPSGTTPCSRNRHKAMASLRAKATMPTLRPRIPLSANRSCHHLASLLPG